MQRVGALHPVTLNGIERIFVMTRRDFLKTTSAALAAVGPLATVTGLPTQLPTSGHRPMMSSSFYMTA